MCTPSATTVPPGATRSADSARLSIEPAASITTSYKPSVPMSSAESFPRFALMGVSCDERYVDGTHPTGTCGGEEPECAGTDDAKQHACPGRPCRG